MRIQNELCLEQVLDGGARVHIVAMVHEDDDEQQGGLAEKTRLIGPRELTRAVESSVFTIAAALPRRGRPCRLPSSPLAPTVEGQNSGTYWGEADRRFRPLEDRFEAREPKAPIGSAEGPDLDGFLESLLLLLLLRLRLIFFLLLRLLLIVLLVLSSCSSSYLPLLPPL